MFKTRTILELLETEQPPLDDVLDAITSGGSVKEIDYLINLLRTAMQYQHLHDSAVYVVDCALISQPGDERGAGGSVRNKIAPPMALLSALNCEPIRKITPEPFDVASGGKTGSQRTHWANSVLINSMAYDPRHLDNVISHPYTAEFFDLRPPRRGFTNPALTRTIEILQAFKDDPNGGAHALITAERLNGDPTPGPAVIDGRLTRVPRRYGYFSNEHFREPGARKTAGDKSVRGLSMTYFKGALAWLQKEEAITNGRYDLTRYITVPTETDFAPVDIRHALLYETLRYARLANARQSDVQATGERHALAWGISPAVVDAVVVGLMRIMMAADTETVLWRAVQLRRKIGRQIRFITSEYSQLSIATASRLQITRILAEDLITDEAKSFVPKRIAAAPLVDRVERSRRRVVKDRPSDPRQTERNKEQRLDKYTQAAHGFSYDPDSGVLTRTDTGKAIAGRSDNVRFKGDNLYKLTLVRYCMVNQGLIPNEAAHLAPEELSIRLINPQLPLPERLAFNNMTLSYRAPTVTNQQQPTTLGLIRAHEDNRAAMKVKYDRHTGELRYRELYNGRQLGTQLDITVDGFRINRNRVILLCLAQNKETRETLRDTIIPDDFSPQNAHLMRLKMLPYSGDQLPTPERFVIEVDPKFERYYQESKGRPLPRLADLQAFRPYSNATTSTEPYADSGTDLEAFEEFLNNRQSDDQYNDCPLV